MSARSSRTGEGPADLLPLLARAAADRRRARKEPLSRSEALTEAPWDARSMPAPWERAFREAYADRLEERGLARPARASGARAPGGVTQLVQIHVYVSEQEREELQARAKAAGLSLSTWARRKLAEP